jgi:spermidine synthase
VILEKESAYHQIRVAEKGEMRTLQFGRGALQGAVYPDDPVAMALSYTRALPIGLAFVQPRRVLMIGLGTGSVPRLLRAGFPDLEIDVAEIDPDVVEVARQHFFVREDPLYRVWTSDGRTFVKQAKEPYDLVILDAFHADTIPFHLTTVEFLREVKGVMTDSGAVVSNLAQWKTDGLYGAMLKTYQAAFGRIALFPVRERANVVLAATADGRGRSKAEVQAAAQRLQGRMHASVDLAGVAETYAEPPGDLGDAPVLTDDYAPVEALMGRR